jgi:hypothetical protein
MSRTSITPTRSRVPTKVAAIRTPHEALALLFRENDNGATVEKLGQLVKDLELNAPTELLESVYPYME